MKVKNIILVLIIIFGLTGCADVTYNIDINKDLKVSEEVFITGTEDYFNNFYKNLPITIVKEFYDDSEQIKPLKNANYTYELKSVDVKYPGVFAKKSYSSIDDYVNNTIFKGQSFSNIKSDIKDNLVNINVSGFIPYDEDVTYGYPVSRLIIKIKLPFVVTENNADSVDKKDNIYTWNIDSTTTDKEIKLTFDKNKIYVYNVIMYISILILIIICIIIGIVSYKIYRKNKLNNRIYE